MTPQWRRGHEATEVLLEAATSAFRERTAVTGCIEPSPAWWDLAPAERDALFERQWVSRVFERAVDPRGLSTTAHAVLDRVPWIDQLDSR